MIKLGKRFWSKVNKSAPNDCWEWTARKNKGGYGCYGGLVRTRLTHRLAYMAEVGAIPEGLFVLHRCDNPACVNPAHLWIGTQAENNRDMVEKGRNSTQRGEANPRAKHTAEQVLAVRHDSANGMKNRAIATKHGVHINFVRSVVYRQNWNHI